MLNESSTVASPTEDAGVAHSTRVEDTNAPAVVVEESKRHRIEAESTKLNPPRLSVVDPVDGPEEGEMPVTSEEEMYWKVEPEVVKSSSFMEISSGTIELAFWIEAEGDVQRREEEDRKVAGVDCVPNLHRIETPPKLAPVMVTSVDPAIEPEGGEMAAIEGEAVKVKERAVGV